MVELFEARKPHEPAVITEIDGAVKYGELVKVYSMGAFSKEVCGGPHVQHTGELGHFRILKEEAVGRGVRRIRAVLEQ